MRDNLRRYRARRDAFTQGYPGQPTGPVPRHLPTLAALIRGIVGRKSTPLPTMAAPVPDGAQPASRVTRLTRWLRNDQVTEEGYFVPYIEVLVTHRALPTLVLVIDGSVVGRGGVALMLPVVYKGRALPMAGLVRAGKHGHVPEAWPLPWLAPVHKRIPAGAQVVLRGDGALDGTRLQPTGQEYPGASVVRTGSTIIVVWDGERCRCDTVAACLQPGTLVTGTDVRVPEEAYGPLRLLCCWAKGENDPRSLLTHIASADEACRLEAQRVRIETFFSDQQRRGCALQKSPRAAPQRLGRLCMAAC